MNRFVKSTAVLLCILCPLSLFGGCTSKTTDGTPSVPSAPSEPSAPSLSQLPSAPQSFSEAPPASEESKTAESPLPSSPSIDPSKAPSDPIVNEPLTFSLENAAGSASREVTVPLRIENNEGIAGYSLTVTYDPQVLTFVSCKSQVKNGFAATNSTVSGKVRVMCTISGGNKITLNDVCAVLTFRINESANVGSYPLGLIIADAADSVYRVEEDGSMPNVECTLKGATLNVHC